MSSERIPIGLPKIVARLKRRVQELEAANEAHLAWIKTARHHRGCQAYRMAMCTCGLWEFTGGGSLEDELAGDSLDAELLEADDDLDIAWDWP